MMNVLFCIVRSCVHIVYANLFNLVREWFFEIMHIESTRPGGPYKFVRIQGIIHGYPWASLCHSPLPPRPTKHKSPAKMWTRATNNRKHGLGISRLIVSTGQQQTRVRIWVACASLPKQNAKPRTNSTKRKINPKKENGLKIFGWARRRIKNEKAR